MTNTNSLMTILLTVLPLGICAGQDYQPAPMYGTNGWNPIQVMNGADGAIVHELLPDGRLLLGGGGYFSGCNCNHISLVKLDTLCGKLDASFGNGGTIGHVFDQRSLLYDLAVLGDSRILACGQNAPDNSGSQQICGIYRFNSDGSPDNSMDGDGWRALRFDPVSSGYFSAVLPMNDGRFYAAGISFPNINGGQSGPGVMRFLEDGSLDPSYSMEGIQWLSSPWVTMDAVYMPDSSVLVLAATPEPNRQLGFIHFANDGSIAPTLTTVAIMNNGDHRVQGIVLEDGRILVGGNGQDNSTFMARFLPDLSLDATYGTDGISSQAVAAVNPFGGRFDRTADGGSVQFGSGAGGGALAYAIMRDVDGALVGTFGTGGVLTIANPTGDQAINGGALLSSNRIIAYGSDYFQGEQVMSTRKYTTEPSLGLFADLGADTGFCPGGSVLLDAGFAGSTYLWNNAATSQELTVNTEGTYHVAITDAQGCTDRDTVLVQAFPAPPVPVIYEDGPVDMFVDALPEIQWYLDGVAIPGATGDTWTAQANGSYTVVSTDPGSGCSTTSEPFVVINVGLGEVPSSQDRILAYPNPLEGALHVRMPASMDAMRAVYLLDAAGRIVATWPDRSLTSTGRGVITLEVPSDLAPGSYVLVVATGVERTTIRVTR